jgi:hypothetical protein
MIQGLIAGRQASALSGFSGVAAALIAESRP